MDIKMPKVILLRNIRKLQKKNIRTGIGKNREFCRLEIEKNMETQLLREQEIFPSKEVLKDILGEIYEVFEALEKRVTQDDFALTLDWR
jgi:hypothetical protein